MRIVADVENAWNGSRHSMPGLDCEHAGVVVVDCDRRPGKDGVVAFAKLCEMLGVNLEGVPHVLTPGGGVHYYFGAIPGSPVPNSAGVLADGVDIRGVGGYVVAPGGVRDDGKSYEPKDPPDLQAFIAKIRARDLPIFPWALFMHLSGRANVVPFPATPHHSQKRSKGQSWDLAAACERVASAPEGTRNDVLNREAFTAGLRAAPDILEHVAAQLTEAAGQAGLDEQEIARTVTGALARGNRIAGGGGEFERTAEGAVKKSFKNAMIAVNELGIVACRNSFTDKVLISNASGGSILASDHEGAFTDNAMNFIRSRIQETFGFDTGKEHLLDAIESLAEDARFDPVNEWLDNLKWDGTPRLKAWLPAVTGAPAEPLYEAVGKILITAMVMRARYPASKWDLCFVFEGNQGCGKSSLAGALASGPGEEYFCDAPGLVAMDNKVRAELLSGRWLVELAELSGMGRAESEGVKAFLSQSSDQYRAAYARNPKDRARTCVFVATTNAQAYLTDFTGNRRFVPVPCKKIELAKFISDRDQLFAEAVQVVEAATASRADAVRGRPLPHAVAMRFGLDANLWQAAAEIADARRVTDPVEDVLPSVVEHLEKTAKMLPSGRKFISSSELRTTLQLRLNTPVRNNNIATWMAALGWSQAKQGSGQNQVRGYAK
jgi:hypothetical protein